MAQSVSEFDLLIESFGSLRGGEIVNYQGTYFPSETYMRGDMVTSASTIYVSLTGECGLPNSEPLSNPNAWAVGGSGTGGTSFDICSLPPAPTGATGSPLFAVCMGDGIGSSTITLDQVAERLGVTTARTVRYDIPGTYQFEVPEGVTTLSITVQGGQGGGGGGGGGTWANFRGGGGGGGAGDIGDEMTISNISVTPGEIFDVTVGAGGTFGAGGLQNTGFGLDAFPGDDGEDGEPSSVSQGVTTIVSAAGGESGKGGGGGTFTGPQALGGALNGQPAPPVPAILGGSGGGGPLGTTSRGGDGGRSRENTTGDPGEDGIGGSPGHVTFSFTSFGNGRYVILSGSGASGTELSTIDQTGLQPNQYYFTVPSGINILNIDMVGGGGGGGGNAGGGGGSGNVVNRLWPVNTSEVYYFEVGIGGASGIGSNNGSDGGTSRMRNVDVNGNLLLIAVGGRGGVANGPGGRGYYGGGGGQANVGGIGIIDDGNNGPTAPIPGNGRGGGEGGLLIAGSGTYGGGGGAAGGGNSTQGGPGTDGTIPGSGGGGGGSTVASIPQNGGNGANGQIIIAWTV